MSTLILSASPKKHGNSMQIAKTLHGFLANSHIVSLADFDILPCNDCGFCKKNKNKCSLDSKDDCNTLFSLCLKASCIIIVTPLYFYHAPAHLKAFIDRTQRFWNEIETKQCTKQLHAIYVAARQRGDKLGQGLDLTLKYFAPLLSCEFKGSTCLYGLENPEDFLSSSEFALIAQEKISTFVHTIKNA